VTPTTGTPTPTELPQVTGSYGDTDDVDADDGDADDGTPTTGTKQGRRQGRSGAGNADRPGNGFSRWRL
jgi:hypothetical protein